MKFADLFPRPCDLSTFCFNTITKFLVVEFRKILIVEFADISFIRQKTNIT